MKGSEVKMISVGGYVRHIFVLALIVTAGRPLEICQAWNHPASPASNSAYDGRHSLSFQARVRYQRALEEVYWKHRTWSDSKNAPKPELDQVLSIAQIEAKVRSHLEISNALDRQNRSATTHQLQAEIYRMANNTKRPEMLHELWAALGNDPYLIAECLARPLVEHRLGARGVQSEGSYDTQLGIPSRGVSAKEPMLVALTNPNGEPSSLRSTTAGFEYRLPDISTQSSGCSDNSWTAASLSGPPGRRVGHAAVWTGSEMIVWGGYYDGKYFNDGGRYDPATDTWRATSLTGAPSARRYHVVAWTGVELILWGGSSPSNLFTNDGARYNPMTDSWRAMSDVGAPVGRYAHTGLWTGNELIVWGGTDGNKLLNTGARYDPTSDTWRPMSTSGAPAGRRYHTVVWTGTEMIVWGGEGNTHLNTGGRYNPYSDTWVATSTVNAPTPRDSHSAIYTGHEMIIWGGSNTVYPYYLSGGARYSPAGDFWSPISASGAPGPRSDHSAIWTGNEMILWGGATLSGTVNTGGRYDALSDSWKPTNTSSAPAARYFHTAVWTGSEMIVFGATAASGGRYCVSQATQQCSYSVTPSTGDFSSSGGTGSVSVSALGGCGWTAASNAAWVTISSSASGNGNGFVNYAVSANPTTSGRSATLMVGGRAVSITQQGSTSACTYSISPTFKTFGSGGGSSTVNIISPNGCAWTATSSVAWISLGSSSGSGNGAVSYSVSANRKANARTGTISIGGQILTIKEKGR
jgi:N-acetylneuraminic acid mutarotase